ncbi:alcohol dehydrogenase catalytic domain-containing protein [Sporomusa sphaeroides]|uniref:alcohol dehydrogenase catalytic domain-containing protein n=1 Tax=Sporomusa sphaeroides TaxID=47679 RepID=UPI00202F2101|nr:alcohol dehydrogenase catalytic domain-containing protein [Sporomusa sphaeroides]MCM0759886.1 alcohol dehydrogenase catalytic domain-containing protein [Sporomusa sphaeroides DSM 2875]HML34617.1 alcohol dehydrogenase catalytic domain-containing protein [Sporomusa sphaeroides]
MKAVVYHKPYSLTLEDVPDPELQDSREILVRVTSTAICGSDLHIYHGLQPMLHDGVIPGHEFMGVVEEVGKDVKRWKRGDRVLVPFPIACGECIMCNAKLWSHCERSNENGELAAAFGHGGAYGNFQGGQAEFVRVPYADVSPILVPDDLTDEQALFVTDILPTAYWIVDVAGVKPGDSVAVFGCGPVGILAQRCAIFKGARRVYAVDQVPYRLEYARKLNPGVETINFRDHDDPGEVIRELTDGRGVDVAIDAVGFEAEPTDSVVAAMVGLKRIGIPPLPGTRPEDQPAVASVSAINWEVKALRHGGSLGLAGVYGAKADGFPIGDIFAKGITINCGQALVQNYTHHLLQLIQQGQLRADDIITHRLSLDDAMTGYEKFGRRIDNCLKVVMHPQH